MTELGERLLEVAEEEKEAMPSFLTRLVLLESPGDVPKRQVLLLPTLLNLRF